MPSLHDQLQNIMASSAIPSVITTGAASSVPNPAYTAIEIKQKKAAAKVALIATITVAADMLFAAADLQFEVPDFIMALIESLKALVIILNAIPG